MANSYLQSKLASRHRIPAFEWRREQVSQLLQAHLRVLLPRLRHRQSRAARHELNNAHEATGRKTYQGVDWLISAGSNVGWLGVVVFEGSLAFFDVGLH